MTAADTNVLVRLIIEDDPEQAARAKRLFDTTVIFIPKTVLLETEWVLRRLYGLDRETVLKSLARVLGLPNVSIEQPAVVYRAWRWAALGMDFADALHLWLHPAGNRNSSPSTKNSTAAHKAMRR